MSPGFLLCTLPDQFQPELNLPRRSRGLVQSGRERAAVEINHRIVLPECVQEAGRQEIRVIQDIEELGPELDVEGFRDGGNFRILED